jgi:hypothetical protein
MCPVDAVELILRREADDGLRADAPKISGGKEPKSKFID